MKHLGGSGPYISLLFKIGTVMILSIIVFFIMGLLLVKYLELSMIVLVVFVLIGVFCGFYYIFLQLRQLK